MIEILDKIARGHRFDEFHQFSINILSTQKSKEGWITCGFMGLLPLIEKELAVDREPFFSYGFDNRLVLHMGSISYNDPSSEMLIDRATDYFGVTSDILIKIAGYHQIAMTFEAKGEKKSKTIAMPKYPIPAPWNTHRPDILLNPISARVISMNISAMLNWEIVGRKFSNYHVYWSAASLN